MRTDIPVNEVHDFSPGMRVVCIAIDDHRRGKRGTVQSIGPHYVHVTFDGHPGLKMFRPWDITITEDEDDPTDP